MTPALVLTRSDVQALLGYDDCIAAVESAFRLHAEGRSLRPGVLGVPSREGGFHVKAAGLDLGRLYERLIARAIARFHVKHHP